MAVYTNFSLVCLRSHSSLQFQDAQCPTSSSLAPSWSGAKDHGWPMPDLFHSTSVLNDFVWGAKKWFQATCWICSCMSSYWTAHAFLRQLLSRRAKVWHLAWELFILLAMTWWSCMVLILPPGNVQSIPRRMTIKQHHGSMVRMSAWAAFWHVIVQRSRCSSPLCLTSRFQIRKESSSKL